MLHFHFDSNTCSWLQTTQKSSEEMHDRNHFTVFFFLCKYGMIVSSDLQSRIQSTEKQTEMGCSIYSKYNSYNITESLPEPRNYRDSSFQSVTKSTLVGSILSLVDSPGLTAAMKRINSKQENIALPKFSAICACAHFSVSLTSAIKSEDVFGREKTPKQGQ